MVFSSSLPYTAINMAPILFLISFLTLTHSQITPTASSPPTLAECGPLLLPLSPCAPFAQGQSPEPTQDCCLNLIDIYKQQKDCLCLFLNGTALASLPINTTLALQLPGLCSLQIDPSTCSTSVKGRATRPGPGAPTSQVSFKRSPTSSAAGAPSITVAPRPSTVRFGMGKSSSYKIAADQLRVAVAAIFVVLAYLP